MSASSSACVAVHDLASARRHAPGHFGAPTGRALVIQRRGMSSGVRHARVASWQVVSQPMVTTGSGPLRYALHMDLKEWRRQGRLDNVIRPLGGTEHRRRCKRFFAHCRQLSVKSVCPKAPLVCQATRVGRTDRLCVRHKYY
jgi:hypothetical protein